MFYFILFKWHFYLNKIKICKLHFQEKYKIGPLPEKPKISDCSDVIKCPDIFENGTVEVRNIHKSILFFKLNDFVQVYKYALFELASSKTHYVQKICSKSIKISAIWHISEVI